MEVTPELTASEREMKFVQKSLCSRVRLSTMKQTGRGIFLGRNKMLHEEGVWSWTLPRGHFQQHSLSQYLLDNYHAVLGQEECDN